MGIITINLNAFVGLSRKEAKQARDLITFGVSRCWPTLASFQRAAAKRFKWFKPEIEVPPDWQHIIQSVIQAIMDAKKE